jgi:hypothetical protein
MKPGIAFAAGTRNNRDFAFGVPHEDAMPAVARPDPALVSVFTGAGRSRAVEDPA